MITRFSALSVVAALSLGGSLAAQVDSVPPKSVVTPVPVPFGVGEKLIYDVKFGPVKVGEGTMEVVDIVDVRGREAFHTRFRVKGGLAFYRVDDLLESWFDVETGNSLRFVQDTEHGGKTQERRFEIFPDRQMFQEGDKPEQPSVLDPLDEGAFLYFVRTMELEVGKTYTLARYYRPDRNPLTLKVLKREKIIVPAGRFDAIVIQPIINSPRGIFKKDSQAQVWLSDDKDRIMLQAKTRTAVGSLNLYLRSYQPTPPRSE